MKNNRIISCVAGRSGGHIIPCMTLAKKYTDKGYKIIFFTSGQSLDTEILKTYTTIAQQVPLTLMNVPYKKIWLSPLFVVQFFMSFIQSLYTLIKNRPERLITTGGYIALPACLAATLLRIPVDLYELNVIPGRATKCISYLTSNIFICFSKTASYFSKKTVVTEYPIRFSEKISTEKISSLFPKYDPKKKTVLVLGGSQGSHFINQQVCQLTSLYGSSIQIIHQTGAEHINLLKNFYTAMHIEGTVFAFQENLAPYYCVADIVICRSGAGTLFETLFFKKPCITIPLETATTDHQVDNAYALQEEYPELFSVIRHKDLQADPLILFNTISHFLDQPRELER